MNSQCIKMNIWDTGAIVSIFHQNLPCYDWHNRHQQARTLAVVVHDEVGSPVVLHADAAVRWKRLEGAHAVAKSMADAAGDGVLDGSMA